MVSFALPVVALSKLVGGRIEEPVVQERLEKLTASAVAAVSLGIFFLIVLLLVPPIPALVTTWILAVSSGLFSTVGQNLWQHDGVILGSLLVLLLEFRGTGRRSTLVQGLICGMMPACRVIAVAFLVPMGIWVVLRSPRRGALMACGASLGYLPWMGYYWSVYGSPFGPSVGQMAGALWSAEVIAPIAGVLISPGRGLLIYQPWIVLALLLGVTAVRHGIQKGPSGWWVVCIQRRCLASGDRLGMAMLVGRVVFGVKARGRGGAAVCLLVCPADCVADGVAARSRGGYRSGAHWISGTGAWSLPWGISLERGSSRDVV